MTTESLLPLDGAVDLVQALHVCGVFDHPPELAFDELTRLAAIVCQTPIAMLSFFDSDREWFKSKLGFETGEVPRSQSLGNIVVSRNELVTIQRVCADPLLSQCALVSTPPYIDFYAGLPISADGGHVIGVLSVADTEMRDLSDSQVEALRMLVHQVESLLTLRLRLNKLKEAISSEYLANEGLRESRRALETLIGNLPGVVYRCRNDAGWSVELISEGCLELTGYSASEFIEGKVRMVDIIHPDDVPVQKRQVPGALRRKTPYQFIYRLNMAGGGIKWVWEQGCGVYSEEGKVLALEGFITDITEHKQAEERIRRMAYFDGLTSLPNRLSLREALGSAIAIASKEHDPVALLHIEVDNFREITETLGYREGDRLLQDVATRLTGGLGEGQLVAHIAESSFSVLLTKADAGRATKVARNILQVLGEPIELSDLLLEVDCSIGIALFPGHGSDPDTLLRRANVAHYGARQAGSKTSIYAGSVDSDNAHRLTLMTELRRAINFDELFLVFQPKMEMGTRRICGAEALTRWKHPAHGIMSPGQFIYFAERSGLITQLTYWAIGAALREGYVWHGSGEAVPIAVNLSSHDLRDPNLMSHISESLETWGAHPDWIQFELTESCLMEDIEYSQLVLKRLRDLGFKLFIDDFGTGYSSLSYLRKLPVDYVKIDQSFVMSLGNDDDSAAIVRSTIELAHNLGFEVVAEGVESEVAMGMLAEWGCEEVQGYWISKPIRGGDFQEWKLSFH
ncbi:MULTISPECIES: bifunctional diguanylate cyclase/phosphodiesterase [unclassified Pseudomonas]|uniref:putative bifunctional diguanylate cyclase/phosphodiesterase n=1 Tax=unclassified Pseudomonas TaxID=196821 RepID=UPI0015B769CE|nr:EAL domain-containing protein [Pseudomonas sp. JG-B]